jgi:predicted nucleic acid-binding protein
MIAIDTNVFVYSEDMQHGAVYSGVEIVNPFL